MQKKRASATVAIPPSSTGSKTIKWVAFALYTLAVVFGAGVHEQWADEAQAWLLARDASFSELLLRLTEEYHPPLWYLLLMPFAKAGMPYAVIRVFPVAIMIATAYLILFKTKLKVWPQVLVLFSYYFVYEYSVIARSYCLVAFFAIVIAALYPQRFNKPWLFALCIIGLYNSHVLAFSLAAGITVLYLMDAIEQKQLNKTVIGSILLACAGGMYLLPFLLRKTNITTYYAANISNPVAEAGKALSNSVLVSGDVMTGVLLFALCALLLGCRTKPLLLLLTGISGTLYILAFSYTASVRHQGVLFVILLCCYSIAPYYRDDKFNVFKALKYPLDIYGQYLLGIAVVLQLPTTLKTITAESAQMYSGAKDAADFILENKLESRIISAHQGLNAIAVLPYLPADTKCYYPESNRFGTYYIYDSSYVNGNMLWSVDYAVKLTHDRFAGRLNEIVFLFNYPVDARTTKYLDLLYQSPEIPIHHEETYFIYKFKDGVK